MKKYKITVKQHGSVALSILCFLLGVYIILGLALPSQPQEFITIEGKYYSHREVSRIWKIRSAKFYIAIELPTGEVQEYRIHNVSLGTFEDEEFLENIRKGDYLKIVVQDANIVSVEDQTQSYLKKIDAMSDQKTNTFWGYCIGATFVLFGIIAFFCNFSIKRRRR